MKTYITASELKRRYKISDMTLWRWIKDENLGFPQPLVIRRRRMFIEAELVAFDNRQRRQVASGSSEAA